jgi:hypothetical protein
MRYLTTVLLVVFLFTQILSLDFDNLFDLAMNKKAYINVLIAAICLISYQLEKKKNDK